MVVVFHTPNVAGQISLHPYACTFVFALVFLVPWRYIRNPIFVEPTIQATKIHPHANTHTPTHTHTTTTHRTMASTPTTTTTTKRQAEGGGNDNDDGSSSSSRSDGVFHRPEFDIDERDQEGCTPLHVALLSKNLDAARLLLECGVMTTRRLEGSPPAHVALSVASLGKHRGFGDA